MNNTLAYQGYTASMAFDTDDKIIVGRSRAGSDGVGASPADGAGSSDLYWMASASRSAQTGLLDGARFRIAMGFAVSSATDSRLRYSSQGGAKACPEGYTCCILTN